MDQRPHILIVEDDDELLQVLKFVLEDANYKVSSAADGPDALKIAASQDIDLVLLDISLTTMSGFEVARRLREDSARPPRLIAVHTAMSEAAVREELDDFDRYLGKGDDVAEFLQAIASVLAAGPAAGRPAG